MDVESALHSLKRDIKNVVQTHRISVPVLSVRLDALRVIGPVCKIERTFFFFNITASESKKRYQSLTVPENLRIDFWRVLSD
jgi:hypothetical protein